MSGASAVTLSDKNEASYNGSITEPHKTFRYKLNVKNGDAIGLTLKMANDYDDQLSLRFYAETSTTSSKPIIIDDVLAGIDEGAVYEAKADGTLVIEVMDKNARYSSQGKSTFTLGIKQNVGNSSDIASKSNPIAISQLPFNTDSLSPTTLQLFTKGERGARYFTYQPTEDQTVLMSLGAIPGLNTSVNVYSKEQWDKYVNTPNGNQPLPLYSIDRNGKSVGEKSAYTFNKDNSYVIELSSAPISVFTLPKYDEQTDSPFPYTASLEKVDFSMSTLSLPDDEDGLTNDENIIDSSILESSVGFVAPNTSNQIINNARPLNLNVATTAYIQTDSDADWYKYTPTQNELDQINLKAKKEQQLTAEIYVYNAESNSFEYIASSFDYFSDQNYVENNQDIFNSLQNGETYYIRISSFNGITDLPYTLSVKSHGQIEGDEYEPNNDFPHAKALKSYSEIDGNFSSTNDVDYFYYKNSTTKTLLQGFEFMAFPLNDDETGSIPKLLTNDLPINITVYEDTNGNKKLDGSEREKGSFYQNYGDFTKGSFQTKPNHGYFFEVANAYSDVPNIHQYGLRFYSMTRTDEDAKAKYKNGLPSITLPLKSSGKNTYVGTGYLNANVANGDKDFFKFVNDKTRTISFTLDMPIVGMNGRVSFYDSHGKLLGSFNRYTFSDAEVGQITLKKGTYFIRVDEVNGISDYDSYQLTISK